MAVDKITLLQDEYDEMVGTTNKLKSLLTNAIGDIERLRSLVNELYGLVGTVNDEGKFKAWKVSAGLFQEIDLPEGGTYWIRNRVVKNSDWELVIIDVNELGDEEGLENQKIVYYMSTTGDRIPLNTFNGLEYDFVKVEKPV